MAILVGGLTPGILAQNLHKTQAAQPRPVLANEPVSQFVGGPDFRAVAMTADPAGNTYVVGRLTVTLESGVKSSDLQLFKFNPQFEQVFRQSYGGSGTDSPSAMVDCASGSVAPARPGLDWRR